MANREGRRGPVLSQIVGKHCEGGDILVRDEFLPDDVAPGDLIAIPAAGAYSRSMASNYNHVPRPPVVAVSDGRLTTLLTARDTGRPAGAGPRCARARMRTR